MAEENSSLLSLDRVVAAVVGGVIVFVIGWLLQDWPASGRSLVSAIPRACRKLRDSWRWCRWRPVMDWDQELVHGECFDDRNKVTRHTFSVSATYRSRFPDPGAFRYEEAVLVVRQKPGTVGSLVPSRFPLDQPQEISWLLPPSGSEAADLEPLVLRFTKRSYSSDVPKFDRDYRWEIHGIHVELGKVLTRELHPHGRNRATRPPAPTASDSGASQAPKPLNRQKP